MTSFVDSKSYKEMFILFFLAHLKVLYFNIYLRIKYTIEGVLKF